MITTNENNEIETLIATGKALGAPNNPGNGREIYAVVPDCFNLKPIPLAPLPPLPKHIRQSVTLHDADSFISYVRKYRAGNTMIFASSVRLEDVAADDSGGAEFTAKLDYHEPGSEAKARRCAHTATYPVPLSLEFSRWLRADGKGIPQADFVKFIEANAADIVTPDTASLMELVLNFESRSEVKFQTKIDRTTGGRVLSYSDEVQSAGAPSVGQLKVPDMLTLRIPIFEAGKLYDLRARLEYRPQNGKLTIVYHLQQPHVTFRKALSEVRAAISAGLDEIEILTGEAGEPDSGFDVND